MSVSIGGPTDIYADVSYQWYAKLWGDDAYTYSWKVKDAVSDQYYPIGQTGPLNTFITEAPAGKNFILQLFVTDKVAASGYAELLINTTIRPLKVNINGPNEVTANVATKWTANIEGGLPPYSYIWTKKIEGDFKDLVVGQNNNCTIKADKNFALKLVIKDAQGNTAFSTKDIAINPFAPITSSITGDKVVYLHQAGNWQTEIAGGQPPYLVNWLKKKEGQNYSLAAFAQGFQCSNQLQQEGVFYIKALVKDANGILKESPEFKVMAIYQQMQAVIENENNQEVAPGEKIDWKASVAGGKPGYTYQWKVGKSLDALTTISQTSSIVPTTTCSYQAKFNNAGKYFIVLSITDEFNKTVTVNKEFIVKEKPIAVNTPIPIEGLNGQNVFSYSPNPVQSNFTVIFNMEKDAYVEISLIDSKDKTETKLYQQQCTKGRYQKNLNTGTLKSGVYIIQLRWRNEQGVNTAVDKIILIK
jgi:hypothetical protein